MPQTSTRSLILIGDSILDNAAVYVAPNERCVIDHCRALLWPTGMTGYGPGGPGGFRTHDLRIKSPLLCLLSYQPKKSYSAPAAFRLFSSGLTYCEAHIGICWR